MKTKKTAGRSITTGLTCGALAASVAFLLAGCGSSGSATTSTNNATPTAMTGTVAVGGAVTGANITVIDVNGHTVTTTSDPSGNYSISLAGLTAPLLVIATDPTGVHPTLASVVETIPTGTDAPLIGNVTYPPENPRY